MGRDESRSLLVILVLVSFIASCRPLVCQLQVAPVSVETRGFTAPGYFAIAPLQQDTLVFVDDYGRPLFHTRVGLHTNVQTWRNKFVTHFSGTQRSRFFVRRDARLQPIDTFRVQAPAIADFHEGKVWTDTSMILLGFEEVTMDQRGVIPGGQPDATVLVGVIEEQTFDGRVVFRWRSIDHIALTESTSDIDLTQNYIDYIHINSIWRYTNGDLLVSCRHTDQVIRIDRQTGDVVWRLGGSAAKRNDFRFVNDTVGGFTGFSHQHTAQRTRRGTIMMFDNGNLKPEPRRSRVVEYVIDEGARTVRAIWQFSADSVGFIEAMGNVEELPGGNLVIGYGNESALILAHEVDREHGIVCTIRNPASVSVNPYRVVKTIIGMSAILDTVTVAGIFRLADQDSTTGVTLDLTAVRGRHVVAAERHHIAPPAMMFSSTAPQHVYPLRLVIRFRDPDSVGQLMGRTRISLAVLPRGVNPFDVTLYRRDTVGRGVFRAVAAVFDSSSQSFVIDDIFSGELIAARRELREPRPLSPIESDTVASAAVVLTAQVEPGADSCVFRIWSDSANADTMSVRVRVSADGTAFCVLDQLESDRTYRWHARAIGSVSLGASSPARRLATDKQGLTRCIADPTMFTMDLPVGKVPVRWLGGDATQRCLVQVMSPDPKDHVGVRFNTVTVDTLSRNLGTASIIADRPGQTYYLRVATLSDGASSAWSDTIGVCTARLPEQALVPRSPVIGQQGVGTSGRMTFTTSDVYDEYDVIISTGLADPAPKRFAVDTPGVAYYANLEPNRQHYWRVVARGSYTDSGAVGMFITGMTSGVDVSEHHDTTVSASRIRLIDGWLTAETSEPIAGVSLVDIRGGLTPIPFEWNGTTARAKMPDAARGWSAVVFYRSDGAAVRAVLAPR